MSLGSRFRRVVTLFVCKESRFWTPRLREVPTVWLPSRALAALLSGLGPGPTSGVLGCVPEVAVVLVTLGLEENRGDQICWVK